MALRSCLLLFYCYLWPQVSFKISDSTKWTHKNTQILQIAQGGQNTYFSVGVLFFKDGILPSWFIVTDTVIVLPLSFHNTIILRTEVTHSLVKIYLDSTWTFLCIKYHRNKYALLLLLILAEKGYIDGVNQLTKLSRWRLKSVLIFFLMPV